MIVSMDQDELFRATLLTVNLYRIDLVTKHDGNFAYVANSSGSLRLWHRRMGHLHLDAIRELSKKDMVKGLNISSLKAFDHVCEGCVLGKSHRLPFPKASVTTHEKMELVVVDLTGPMSVETWSGMLYALLVVEMSTRFGVVRLLKSKDEVPEVLKEIIACWNANLESS